MTTADRRPRLGGVNGVVIGLGLSAHETDREGVVVGFDARTRETVIASDAWKREPSAQSDGKDSNRIGHISQRDQPRREKTSATVELEGGRPQLHLR